MHFPTLAPGHVLRYHVVFPVSSQSAMTRVEPQRETNSSRERRLPPFAAGRRPRRSAGFPRDEHRLFFFFFIPAKVGVREAGAAQRSEVTGCV